METAPGYPWEAPLGAFPASGGRTRFRVWAPRARDLALVAGGERWGRGEEGRGIFPGGAPAGPGRDYAYVVDGAELPDPCSRWQPAGLRGPSRVLDAAGFEWTDAGFAAP